MSRAPTKLLRLLLATACLALFGCGGGGGGGTTVGNPQTGNPPPSISSLSPSSANAGTAGFTLTVNGAGFVSGSVVRWNGSNRVTSFVSPTQLTAGIQASDLQSAGSAQVAVFNPAPGGGTSSALTFTIQPDNPVPTITSLSPTSANAGVGLVNVTIDGTNFINGSTAHFNGSARNTTFVNSTRLQMSISGSDLSFAGQSAVTVVNPPPGGGTSNALPFNVLSNATILQLPTNDLIYDPGRNKIYASVPGRAGAMGNSVVIIDPVQATVVGSIPVGSEPNAMGISDNGQYLYVGLDGVPAVRRVDLNTQTAGLEFEVGESPFLGRFLAADIVVLPGVPGSVAISLAFQGVNPRHAGVAVFDEGVQRPNVTAATSNNNVIEPSASATTLFGYNNEGSEFGFRRLAVDANGVTVTDTTLDLIKNFFADIVFHDGQVYASSGEVVDPATKTLVGTYSGVQSARFVQPDSSTGRTYFLVEAGGFGTGMWEIRAFEQNTFVLAGTLAVTGIGGSATRLLRWGPDGFAFRSTGDQVAILQVPTLVEIPELKILTSQLPPTSGGKTYDFTLSSTGGVPFVDWDLAPGSGPLPAGLTLGPSGRISGTTAAVGADTNFAFTVRATDSASTPQVKTRNLNILVRAAAPGPNNTCPGSATPISNGRIRASLSPYGDMDVYSFQGTAGAKVDIQTLAERLDLDGNPNTTDSFADTVLELLDSNCTLLRISDDLFGVTLDSGIAGFTLSNSGTFYIRVRDFRGDGRPDFIYDLVLGGAN